MHHNQTLTYKWIHELIFHIYCLFINNGRVYRTIVLDFRFCLSIIFFSLGQIHGQFFGHWWNLNKANISVRRVFCNTILLKYHDINQDFKLKFVDSGLCFVQDENNFIFPLLQVGSRSDEKTTGVLCEERSSIILTKFHFSWCELSWGYEITFFTSSAEIMCLLTLCFNNYINNPLILAPGSESSTTKPRQRKGSKTQNFQHQKSMIYCVSKK